MKIRFQWEHVNNTCVATLHCDQMVPKFVGERKHCFVIFGSPPEEPTDEANRLKDAVLSTHGVTNAESDHFSVTIVKGRVFSWEEVKPRIESVMMDHFQIFEIDRLPDIETKPSPRRCGSCRQTINED